MAAIIETKIQKPFLKWVGGKTQIINDIIAKVPSKMKNYHELFVGGGSVLLAILSLQQQGKIIIKKKVYAYDINPNLIRVYQNVQQNKDELFKFITLYMTEYSNIKGDVINRKPDTIDEAKSSKESYYYWLRNKFNTLDKTTIEFSALFMIINKLCFRGLYREGPKGFNVPYGHYATTPTIITKTDLDNISNLIKDVEFICSDFRKSIQNMNKKDFVYLDPPYAPETKTSFVGYTAGGFSLEMHQELFAAVLGLHERGIKFAMSNSNVDLVVNTFKDFRRQEIIARRAINSKKPDAKTTEVIIDNM